jgi:hypothetical protein
MESVCIECRFGSILVEIQVPEKCDLRKLARRTKAFTEGLPAIISQKPIHYALQFAEGDSSDEPNFTVNCACILNVNKKDCSKFEEAVGRNPRIKHLEHQPAARRANIEVIKTQ